MSWDPELIDSIYEAAAVPDLWPSLLERIGTLSETDGGTLFVADRGDVRYVASERIAPIMDVFVRGGWMQRNIRTERFLARDYAGFIGEFDLVTQEEWETDPFYRDFLRPSGGGWCTGTVVHAPSGQLIVFNFERAASRGPVPEKIVRRLDGLRPHLARAGLLSASLELQKARAVAEGLEAVGLPAVVLSRTGRIVAANGLFPQRSSQLRIGAFDRPSFANPASDRMFRAALASESGNDHRCVRSIPAPATEEEPAFVAHLIPVKKTARDIFSSVDWVLVLTRVANDRLPSADLLRGLFDLTPAEAALSRALLTGNTLQEVASERNTSVETVRKQLQSVFTKTGTSRQGNLLLLLSGLQPPRGL
jgi:DNA-binding CsgD family transcriptional regulator